MKEKEKLLNGILTSELRISDGSFVNFTEKGVKSIFRADDLDLKLNLTQRVFILVNKCMVFSIFLQF